MDRLMVGVVFEGVEYFLEAFKESFAGGVSGLEDEACKFACYLNMQLAKHILYYNYFLGDYLHQN